MSTSGRVPDVWRPIALEPELVSGSAAGSSEAGESQPWAVLHAERVEVTMSQ